MKKKNKKKNIRREVDPRDILKLFKQKKKPLSRWEVISGLGMTKKNRKEVSEALRILVRAGKLVSIKGAFGLTEAMRLVTGKLEMKRAGFGFVIPEDQRRKDIFISAKNLNDAWHGDKVVVAVTKERTTKNHEGRIVRILERSTDALACKVLKMLPRGDALCQPSDPRLEFNVIAELEPDGPKIKSGDMVLVAPGDRLEKNLWEGRIQEMLGRETDIQTQEKLAKINNRIPTEFPSQVLDMAESFPDKPGKDDFKGRRDLTALPLVTIDGAKARDFDDAVLVEKTDAGFKLWVAIADVSHYVAQRSALDKEARARGNSYYFPTSVEPMLPQKLSNGLCSLNPDEPRLAVVCEMEFDPQGKPGRYWLLNAVIKSHARLTYAQVHRAVILKQKQERDNLRELLPMLEQCEKLARLIGARRKKRGSLDFDLPEPEILINLYGETEDIRPKARNFAHQIVEEFMIAANESVAQYLTEKNMPCMYRIHPSPDENKLKSLFKILSKTDLASKLPKDTTPEDLQQLINNAEGTPQEFLVSRLLLRSMKQATYSPTNEGHFGLASECYCHFTSPIRRYADLVVHRLVKTSLAGAESNMQYKSMAKLGGHLSDRERAAMDAEREVLKRLTVLFLRDKVGEHFTGVISSMADFGFWVELKEVMAEGMVRLSSLTNDYYGFFEDRQMLVGERTGLAFHLGQEVKVVLESVNLSSLEITLAMVSKGRDFKELI